MTMDQASLVDGEAEAPGLRGTRFALNTLRAAAPAKNRGGQLAVLGATPLSRTFGNIHLVVPDAQSTWVALEAAGGYEVGDVVPHEANMPCVGDRGLYGLPGGAADAFKQPFPEWPVDSPRTCQWLL